MKSSSTKRNVVFLLITLAVFFFSLFISRAVQTSGFSVKVEDVSFVTDEGAKMSGTLYIPKNATADTPAPGILIAPGGNTPHTFYQSYTSEFARRGFVVFAYDYYGAGKSEFAPSANQGAVAAMKYLTSLACVDKNRLAATGHSNGGGQAAAAITSDYAKDAKDRTIFFIGCGISVQDTSVLDGVNIGVVWGKNDEAGQGSFWDTYHTSNMNLSTFPKVAGKESKDIVPGTEYVNAGAKRVLYTPNTFHCLSNIIPSSVKNIVGFMDETMGGTSGLKNTNLVYLWHELFTLVAAIALCVMIFPAGALILNLSFFDDVKRSVPEAQGKQNVWFWVFLAVPAILSALIVKKTIMQGQTLFGKCPQVFNVQSTNGFIWWFFLASVITLVFTAVRYFVIKDCTLSDMKARLAIKPAPFFKSLLLAIMVISIPYFASMVGERLFGQYPRIYQSFFATMTAERSVQFIVYFILFGIMFTVSAFTQVDAMRMKSGGEKSYYWLTLIANALPAILFLGYIFGKLVLTHVTPIRGREMSRAQGAMMGMLILYFIIAKNVTYFYKKTGNMYIVAAVNAAFVAWISVNTPQLIV